MELDQIEAREAGVLQTAVNVVVDVIRGEAVVESCVPAAGPLEILWRDLGGGVEFFRGVRANDLTQQLLAAPLAISPGRIKEIATEIDGALQGLKRLVIV